MGHWLIGIVWIKAPLAYCNGNYVHNNVTHKNVNMLYYVYYPVGTLESKGQTSFRVSDISLTQTIYLFKFLHLADSGDLSFQVSDILMTQAIYLFKFLNLADAGDLSFQVSDILLTQVIYLFKFLTSC